MAPIIKRVVATLRRSRRIWQRNEKPAGAILLRLPPEIREMIYAILFSGGHLDILRVSRMINAEAQIVFYQAGVSRQIAGLNHIHINSCDRALDQNPLIQNFELQCNLYSRIAHGSSESIPASSIRTMQTQRKTSRLDFRAAFEFGSPDVCRNYMLIKLDFGPLSSPTSSTEAEQWIRRLLEEGRSFIGFKVLVVEATRTPRSWTLDDRTRLGAIVNSILEPELGPAKGNDIGRIEYRPWSVVACQKHTIIPDVHIVQPVPSPIHLSHKRVPYKRFEIHSEREAEETWADRE